MDNEVNVVVINGMDAGAVGMMVALAKTFEANYEQATAQSREGLKGMGHVPNSHTPGPWESGQIEDGIFGVRSASLGNAIAVVGDDEPGDELPPGVEHRKDGRANAILIAAAPDLLAQTMAFHGLVKNLLRDFEEGNLQFKDNAPHPLTHMLPYLLARIELAVVRAGCELESGQDGTDKESGDSNE